MVAGAQRVMDYWAAASTTAGPVVRLHSHYAQPRSDYVFTVDVTQRGGGSGRSLSSPADVMRDGNGGGAAEQRPARLSAAQLRARWRGVLRSCTTLQAPAGRGGGAAAAATSVGGTLSLSPPPSLSVAVSGEFNTADTRACSGGAASFSGRHILRLDPTSATESEKSSVRQDEEAAAQRGPRGFLVSHHHHSHGDTAASPETTSSRRSSVFFVAPFSADAPSSAPVRQGRMRRPVTSLALHRSALSHVADQQRRVSHEIYYQVCVKAHEGRMRMLFGLGDAEGKAGGEHGASGRVSEGGDGTKAEEAVLAGEAAYLSSLDATRSEEEAQVLRVIATIDAALKRQLVSAYDHQQASTSASTRWADKDTGPAVAVVAEPSSGTTTPPSSTSSNGNAGSGSSFSSFFASHRPAVLEAVISSTTQRVEAFVDQLLPYQQEGVRWLLRLNTVEHMNGILADDMGLGKTAQTVVYLSSYKDMVEGEVQQPLEELRARHTRLCQRVLGQAAAAATAGSAMEAAGAAGAELLPPWLTWCAAAAAEVEGGGSFNSDGNLGAKESNTLTPTTSNPAAALLSEARSCGRTLQLVKEVKRWLWQLEEEEETAENSPPSSPASPLFPQVPQLSTQPVSSPARSNAALPAADVASLLALKPRRGRPPKHLLAMRAAAAVAAASSSSSGSHTSLSGSSSVAPISLSSLIAAQTQLPTCSPSLNQRLDHEHTAFRPVLILAPLSTLPHWEGEFVRFSRRRGAVSGGGGGAPTGVGDDVTDATDRFRVFVLNGPREQREARMRAFLDHAQQSRPSDSAAARTGPPRVTPVLVIPHDMLAKPLSGSMRHIARVQWHVVVIDEAQRIKSAQSALFKKVRQLSSISRLVLTGTPLQNNTTELFSLLQFLAPKSFTAASGHLFEQLDSALVAASRSTALEDRELHLLLCRRVHRLLMPFILRREKTLLKSALPPIRDYAVLCPLLPFQETQLAEVKRRHQAGTLSGNPHIQYRKILLHPYTTQSYFYVDESVVQTSGKLLVLDFMMRFLQRTRHKFLIFCGWTLVLDVVETLCGMRGIPYVRLDGKTSVEKREANIQVFNRPMAGGKELAEEEEAQHDAPQRPSRRRRRAASGEAMHDSLRVDPDGDVVEQEAAGDEEGDKDRASAPCCFLISKVAGGVGLNLQAADTVFLLDVDYNPQRDAQALSRVYRVGQTREVRVFRLVIDHPIERNTVAIHETKENLGRAVVQAGHYNLHSSVQEREAALQDIFRANTLSQLSQQWTSASPTSPTDLAGTEDAEEREGEEGEVRHDFPAVPLQPLHVSVAEKEEEQEASDTPLSPADSLMHTPMDLPRVLVGSEGDDATTLPFDIKRAKWETADEGQTPHDFNRLSLPPPPAPPAPPARRRRHISFKLESDSAELSKEGSSGSSHCEGGAATQAAEEGAMAAAEGKAKGLSDLSENRAVNGGDDAAAVVEEEEKPPAARLLAMRARLEEVLLRHDGERCVLQDMFRSLEASLTASR